MQVLTVTLRVPPANGSMPLCGVSPATPVSEATCDTKPRGSGSITRGRREPSTARRATFLPLTTIRIGEPPPGPLPPIEAPESHHEQGRRAASREKTPAWKAPVRTRSLIEAGGEVHDRRCLARMTRCTSDALAGGSSQLTMARIPGLADRFVSRPRSEVVSRPRSEPFRLNRL